MWNGSWQGGVRWEKKLRFLERWEVLEVETDYKYISILFNLVEELRIKFYFFYLPDICLTSPTPPLHSI